MTDKRPNGSDRRTTLQDELLADLRLLPPARATKPGATRPRATKPSAVRSAPAWLVGADTPTIIVEWTPLRWSRPSARVASGEAMLSAGPVRISVRGLRR